MKAHLKTRLILDGALSIALAVVAGSWLHIVIMAHGIVAPWDFLLTLAPFLPILLVPFWLALECWVFRPLERLRQASLQAAQGDLEGAEIPAEEVPTNEIGALIHSHNATLKSLRARQQELQELNAILLATEQQRLELLVERLPEGVLLLDAHLRLVMANPVGREYLSVLADAPAGERFTHLDGQPIRKLLAPPPKGRLRHEVEVTGPPPRVFEVDARPMEVGPEAGGWMLMVVEVTREREVRQRVEAQERLAAIGQLAAGIAHDFNNMLTGVIGYAQLLQDMQAELPAKVSRYLEVIISQGWRASLLIRQILDFSRKSIIQPSPLELISFLKELMRLLRRTIPESIHLNFIYEGKDYWIHADPTQIQQVITNLVVNSRDAMPHGGRIEMRLRRFPVSPDQPPPFPGMSPGEWIAFMTSDTGTGIPPEVLPHIFEPFFTTKRPGEGTGLGLAQVYGIVKQHEGFIDVTSQVGQGTTFTLYLPPLASPREAPRESTQEKAPGGRGETILLVEDEPVARMAAREMLEQLGYHVIEATNGREALACYERLGEEIALVLSDMVMPEMGGLDLFIALREKAPSVKFLLLSGYPLGMDAKSLQTQSTLEWMQKPLTLNRLAEALGLALQEKDHEGSMGVSFA